MKTESKYRHILARYINHEITLHCNQFDFRKNENGETLLILRGPTVQKIAGQRRKGNWAINHLWVKIPEESVTYFERYLSLARKIKIDGYIYKYFYKESGNPQAGVKAQNVQILKYKKDIAKQYHLHPGQQLSKKTMEMILSHNNDEYAINSSDDSAYKQHS